MHWKTSKKQVQSLDGYGGGEGREVATPEILAATPWDGRGFCGRAKLGGRASKKRARKGRGKGGPSLKTWGLCERQRGDICDPSRGGRGEEGQEAVHERGQDGCEGGCRVRLDVESDEDIGRVGRVGAGRDRASDVHERVQKIACDHNRLATQTSPRIAKKKRTKIGRVLLQAHDDTGAAELLLRLLQDTANALAQADVLVAPTGDEERPRSHRRVLEDDALEGGRDVVKIDDGGGEGVDGGGSGEDGREEGRGGDDIIRGRLGGEEGLDGDGWGREGLVERVKEGGFRGKVEAGDGRGGRGGRGGGRGRGGRVDGRVGRRGSDARDRIDIRGGRGEGTEEGGGEGKGRGNRARATSHVAVRTSEEAFLHEGATEKRKGG